MVGERRGLGGVGLGNVIQRDIYLSSCKGLCFLFRDCHFRHFCSEDEMHFNLMLLLVIDCGLRC